MRLIDADELERSIASIPRTEWLYVRTILEHIKNAPTVEAVPMGAYEQLKWERDIAVSQLNDYGVQFGEKADCVRVIRCRDCDSAHIFHEGAKYVFCVMHGHSMEYDGFCNYGKRRGD